MQRTFKYLCLTILTTVLFISCGDGVSLQRYYVENQENANFISQDFPISMLKIDKSSFTDAQQEAYNSVQKLNFLGFNASEDNIENYTAEITKVKSILSHEKYNDLMEVSDKGRKIMVKYIGEDDAADEVVVFATDKNMGFGIVRVLGNDMNPEKIGVLINSLQNADFDGAQIENIMNFFK